MAASSQPSTDLLPWGLHSAIICGQTGCSKTVYVLDILESHYRESFANTVLLCPTVRWNKAYLACRWIWTDPEVYVVEPGEHLHDWLLVLYGCFTGDPTLFIINDCSSR